MKLILCDLGNVVIRADHGITHRNLVAYGLPMERARRFFSCPGYAAFARGDILGDEFCLQLIERELGVYVPFVMLKLWHACHMYGIDKATVRILKRVTVPLAFTTDTNVWQTERERELIDIDTQFDPVMVFRSNELGLLKQDPDAFPIMAARLGIEPKDILLVDDSAVNIGKAEVAGFHAHWYSKASELEQALSDKGLLE